MAPNPAHRPQTAPAAQTSESPSARFALLPLLAALAAPLVTTAPLALLPAAVRAQPASAEQVVVTGSVVQRRIEEAPYAIGLVDADDLRRAGPQINLSEALVRVPGLVINNRSNYAQDLQISSRGFGARANFGVRGLRLYADGIPASGPDGQGQVSHFDLMGAQRIEVLRGPFSVLYGNSSGGVISLVGAPLDKAEMGAGIDVGSFGLKQLRASVTAPLGQGFGVRVGASAMSIDGFRPQSEAERKVAHLTLGWQNATDRVRVVINHFDQPAEDPLGLSRTQFESDPYGVAPVATQFDVRKEATQLQAGVSWRHLFVSGVLRESQIAAYTGERAVTQWLAIPPGTQATPRHGGGVIDFDRRYSGVDARLRWALGAVDVLTGVALDRQHDDRRGYENFTGTGAGQVVGVTGRLRRQEDNHADSRDVYAQAEWSPTEPLMLSLGVRTGRVLMRSDDAYLVNGDDSGRVDYDYSNPVAGLRWTLLRSPGESLQLHTSVARGFEAPSLGELAYRGDGSGGFNTTLKPQRSRQGEVGLKWRRAALAVDLVAFQSRVSDEIATLTNAGGRSSFQNVADTTRRGIELAMGWQPAAGLRGQLALSTLDARYRKDFLTCSGIPCTVPSTPVTAGNRIAGTQSGSAWAELAWKSAGLGEFAVEWRAVARTAANDTNTEFAPGYGLAALRWSRDLVLAAGWKAELLVRVDNLFDRVHAASLIVNDANGRFYETGAPRNGLVALRLTGWP
jgi:iron complex outermembrane recepter protein